MIGPGLFVRVEIGVMVPCQTPLILWPWHRTYASRPFGEMAMASGQWPTVIGVPAVFVAVEIGTTFAAVPAYTVLPSGVIARASGMMPTLIGLPAVFVATLTGVTVPDPWFTR